jgi:hypothetical protein
MQAMRIKSKKSIPRRGEDGAPASSKSFKARAARPRATRPQTFAPFGLAMRGGWPTLSRFFLLTTSHVWMVPLQYFNAMSLVWPFRVPDPFGFKKVGVLVFSVRLAFGL